MITSYHARILTFYPIAHDPVIADRITSCDRVFPVQALIKMSLPGHRGLFVASGVVPLLVFFHLPILRRELLPVPSHAATKTQAQNRR